MWGKKNETKIEKLHPQRKNGDIIVEMHYVGHFIVQMTIN
jgi:hypothetical protein